MRPKPAATPPPAFSSPRREGRPAGWRTRLTIDTLRSGLPVRIAARGSSMEPLLRSGDVLLIEPTPPERLRPDDIVVYEQEGVLVAHRLLRPLGAPPAHSDYRVLLTRGDSCLEADRITYRQVLGRVVAFERSRTTVALDSPFGRLLCKLSRWLGPHLRRRAG